MKFIRARLNFFSSHFPCGNSFYSKFHHGNLIAMDCPLGNRMHFLVAMLAREGRGLELRGDTTLSLTLTT